MNDKPKFTVYKVINKCFIIWNIKSDNNIPVYYKWETERLPTINKDTGAFNVPFLFIDYTQYKREWYITFIDINNRIFSATIDDVTGTISTKTFT